MLYEYSITLVMLVSSILSEQHLRPASSEHRGPVYRGGHKHEKELDEFEKHLKY